MFVIEMRNSLLLAADGTAGAWAVIYRTFDGLEAANYLRDRTEGESRGGVEYGMRFEKPT